MVARIQLRPAEAAVGATVEVRLLIAHPQENGLRRDNRGERIQRNLIKDLVCRYAGEEVFRASLGTGIAANPFLGFALRAVRSDDVVLEWLDEAGERGSARVHLAVG